MGAGITVILFGLAIGGVMAAFPKGLWWVTQSWKFRNPDANEPSEIAYALTRAGGVLLIVFALFVGFVMITDEREQAAAERAKQEAAQEAAQAEANFVAPPPETRGLLPVLGYIPKQVPRGTLVYVYYLAPDDAYPEFYRRMSSSTDLATFPCYAKPTETVGPDGGVVVDVELIWAPQRLSDMKRADDCKFGRRHRIDDVSLGPLPAEAPVTTTGAIAAVNGVEIRSAAMGNAVPVLTEEPPEQRATVYDRGVVPIVGYELDRGSLDISYLLPEDADASAGSLDGTSSSGGCEVVPLITGLDTDTVTIDLRLRWSDPSNYYDDEDDAKCRLGTSSSVMTSQWVDVPTGTTVLTDGPIVDRRGKVVVPAASGNRVPRRG